MLWNSDAMRLMGYSPGDSFTVVFNYKHMIGTVQSITANYFRNITGIEVLRDVVVIY